MFVPVLWAGTAAEAGWKLKRAWSRRSSMRRRITLEELRAELAGRGHGFGYGTLHRFLKRRGITPKHRPAGVHR